MNENKRGKYGFLEFSFFFALITHAVGLFSMAVLVMPGMPGGLIADALRISYISQHQIAWRLGWLPWHLSALSDLFIALAFMRAKDLSLLMKVFILLSTLAAVIPDQYGQFLWVTRGTELARDAFTTGSADTYLKFEEPVFAMVCGWAALLYTLLACAWTLALSRLGLAGSKLQSFSWFLWVLSGIASLLFLLSPSLKIPFIVLALANAIFFPGLILWFVFVLENILRQVRPESAYGRLAAWKVPQSGALSRVVELLGNSLVLRRIFEPFPPLALASKIEFVIYINYLLPCEDVLKCLPEGLELQGIGPDGKYALFSILTFRHQEFGPQFLGRLRRFLFSGLVSNWRIHVRDPQTGRTGVYFLSNVTDSSFLSIGARILSESMPMHIVAQAHIGREQDGYSVNLDPGNGSAPDLQANLQFCDATEFEKIWAQGAWQDCFSGFEEFLEYCVPQERSIASQAYLDRISFQEIRLDIPLDQCRVLKGQVSSSAAEKIAGKALPLCFAAPGLNFRFDREHYRKWSRNQS